MEWGWCGGWNGGCVGGGVGSGALDLPGKDHAVLHGQSMYFIITAFLSLTQVSGAV